MSPENMLAGWHSTDDEVAVPVRASSSASESSKPGPSMDMSAGTADHIVLRHQATGVNQASMRLSAILGVVLVLGFIGFTFGFGDLFGDLTGGMDTNSSVINITAEGEFSPNAITVRPGDTVTLRNENADPQVIKSKDSRNLFTVQVIFDTPFTFTVPSDASGTYTYYSETLPDDRTLTIAVGTVETAAASSASVAQESMDIPLPFLDAAPTPSTTTTGKTYSSSSAPVVTVQRTEHSGDTATISITGEERTAEEAVEALGSTVPTNPFTVSSGLVRQSKLEAIASAAKEAQNIHSGAPLQEMVKHKPIRVTETGPADVVFWMLLPAFAGVAILYRKVVAS